MESAGTFANGAFVKANSGYTTANSAGLYANGAFEASNSASLYANGAFGASNSASLYANGAFIQANAVFSRSNNQVWPQANAAFGAANSAAIYANGAFGAANSAASYANGAFGASNSASLYANAAFIQANAVFDRSNNQVWPQANAAFNASNSVSSYANSAFLQANSAFGAANSASLYANGAFTAANVATSAALYANGAFGAANSASAFANGAFINSNNAYTTANSGGLFANGAFGAANSAGQYANAAFTKANSAYSLAGTQAGRLDVIEPIAQAAFTNAASALQNTTGTFAGSLSITENLNVSGTIKFANSSFASTQGLVTISASNTGVTQPTGGDGYVLHMTGKHNLPVRVVSDSFGANGQLVFPLFGGRAARGNVTNPTAVQSGDILTRIGASGFGATSYQSGGTSRIDFVATENHTDSARGTAIKFYNVQEGTNTLIEIASFNANTVAISGVVNPTKGFIYTPRVLEGAQTAITIDFAADSMIYGKFSATVTNSLTNYVAGKVVEVWLTNTAGNGQTVVHGCLANNSTIGSTSLSIAAGRSVHLKYFSIDGDSANTFVAVTYA